MRNWDHGTRERTGLPVHRGEATALKMNGLREQTMAAFAGLPHAGTQCL